MAKNNDRLIDDRLMLIASALNGILSRGVEHYKDGPYSLDTPERIATLAIRIADATLEISNERLPRPRSTDSSAG
jgi:hypothetical protein